MVNVNSLSAFQSLIDKQTSGVNKLHLEFYDLIFTFQVELNCIDSSLRKSLSGNTNATAETSINFTNCHFKKLDCSNIPKTNILETNIVGGSIQELNIINSIFIGKFYINKQYGKNKKEIQIDNLSISDSTFEENFKLHNANVKVFSIENTDFERHADFFKSSFFTGTLLEDKKENINDGDIGFKGINFRGLALFGDTTFKRKLIFKYVTFEGYSHFRKAKLEQGLDLDYSNIQNEINFFDLQLLDTDEAKKHTSQETYRIIKHNFEKIGNKIEANKYLALELEQRKIILENCTNNIQERLDLLVFKVNWISSEFGTNWLKPLGFIFITSLVTIWFLHFSLFIELIKDPNIFKFEYIEKALKELFQYMYILNKNDKFLSSPGVVLFNKALLGYFYYQFLISIRKNTK